MASYQDSSEHLDDIDIEDNKIFKIFEIPNVFNSIKVKELLNIPEKKIIYEILEDN